MVLLREVRKIEKRKVWGMEESEPNVQFGHVKSEITVNYLCGYVSRSVDICTGSL